MVAENDIGNTDFPGLRGGQESFRVGYNQGAIPTRATMKPGVPMTDRSKSSTARSSNKYRDMIGVTAATAEVRCATTHVMLPCSRSQRLETINLVPHSMGAAALA